MAPQATVTKRSGNKEGTPGSEKDRKAGASTMGCATNMPRNNNPSPTIN